MFTAHYCQTFILLFLLYYALVYKLHRTTAEDPTTMKLHAELFPNSVHLFYTLYVIPFTIFYHPFDRSMLLLIQFFYNSQYNRRPYDHRVTGRALPLTAYAGTAHSRAGERYEPD